MSAVLSRLGGLAACAVLLSCGARSGVGSGGANPSQYRRSVGTAALVDVLRQVPRVLSRRHYPIERSEQSPFFLRVLTQWTDRYPLDDEAAAGVTEAQTRLTVTARARTRTGGAADVRVVELVAENMVLMGDSAQWRPGFMTRLFKEYVDGIVDELKTELLTGVRVY